MHALVDSTGRQVYGAGQWQEEKHGRAEVGESCITTQSSIIARRRLLSFRLAPTRSSQATIDLPANGTGISPQYSDGRMKWQVYNGYGKRSLVERL